MDHLQVGQSIASRIRDLQQASRPQAVPKTALEVRITPEEFAQRKARFESRATPSPPVILNPQDTRQQLIHKLENTDATQLKATAEELPELQAMASTLTTISSFQKDNENSFQKWLRTDNIQPLCQEIEALQQRLTEPDANLEQLKQQLSEGIGKLKGLYQEYNNHKPAHKSEQFKRFEDSEGPGPGSIFRKLYDRAVIQSSPSEPGSLSLWQKVKDSLLASETQRSSVFMGALTDYRKQYVNHLAQEVLDEVVAQLADGPEKQSLQEKRLQAQAFGSNNLTSDYDVIIAALQSQFVHLEASVVEGFNRRFREAFGVEAGDFFDTNIYTRGLAPNSTEELGVKGPDGQRSGGTGPYQWNNPAAERLHHQQQDVMALVKQRKFMSDTEWRSYVADLTQTLPEVKRQAVDASYAQANDIYLQSQRELQAKITALQQEPGYAAQPPESLELAASNRLYEEKLKQVNQILQAPNTDPDQHKAELSFAMSHALLFANEPYFSEGTLRHIVGNEQELGRESNKLAINPYQGLQSLNENLGDTLKELRHLAQASLGDVSIHSSKYIGRLSRAMTHTLDALGRQGNTPAPLQTATAVQQALLSVVDPLQALRGGNLSQVPQDQSPGQYAQTLLDRAFQPLVAQGLVSEVPTQPEHLKRLLLDLVQDVNRYVRSQLE